MAPPSEFFLFEFVCASRWLGFTLMHEMSCGLFSVISRRIALKPRGLGAHRMQYHYLHYFVVASCSSLLTFCTYRRCVGARIHPIGINEMEKCDGNLFFKMKIIDFRFSIFISKHFIFSSFFRANWHFGNFETGFGGRKSTGRHSLSRWWLKNGLIAQTARLFIICLTYLG